MIKKQHSDSEAKEMLRISESELRVILARPDHDFIIRSRGVRGLFSYMRPRWLPLWLWRFIAGKRGMGA